MRRSSARMPAASFAVSRSPCCSASRSIAVYVAISRASVAQSSLAFLRTGGCGRSNGPERVPAPRRWPGRRMARPGRVYEWTTSPAGAASAASGAISSAAASAGAGLSAISIQVSRAPRAETTAAIRRPLLSAKT